MRSRAGQPHLGQVVWAVDADAINVRRGVRCKVNRANDIQVTVKVDLFFHNFNQKRKEN